VREAILPEEAEVIFTTYTHISDLAKEAQSPEKGILTKDAFDEDRMAFLEQCDSRKDLRAGFRFSIACRSRHKMPPKPYAKSMGE
jgi:hypothetical protein